MEIVVGIDAGTTHCKVVAVDKKGVLLFSAKRNCTSYTDETGMHEQDPNEVFNLVAELLREAFNFVGEGKIACVSFSTAMHSLLAVGNNGEPLMRAMTWADTRAGHYAALLKQHEQAAEIFAETGVPAHAMTPYCKLVWLKHERPDIFASAAKFISLKEYILYKLFGCFLVDEAMASATGLFSLKTGRWSEAAMQVAGITEDKLSHIVSIFYAQQTLLPAMRQRLAVTGAVMFIAGSGDGGAAQLGSGALLPNEACFTIGTSGAVRTFIHSPITDARQRVFTYLFTANWYFTGGATNNGGVVMQWFARLFLPTTPVDESFDAIIALAQNSEPGAKGLLFVPYLNGERAPVWDAAATGQFAGIRSLHGICDFARAVVEGLLLNMFDIFQSLPNCGVVDAIYANGGFLNNAFTAQLLADVTGRRVLLQRDTDSSAMGAVYEGMLAVGWLNDILDVKQFIAADEEFMPDAANHAVYKAVFERYVGLGK